jgi:putative DNA-invertase from lambdoid prophage Rac
MATILYARVSTAEQQIEHQRAHAEAAGFKIDEVVSDNGGPV